MEETDIIFHFESTDFILENQDKYIEWLISIAESHNNSISSLNYIFCSDDYLLDINKTYLNHDTYTDIITFPYSYTPVESDIYISIDRIKENATLYKVKLEHELKRVMAHGLLHLLGFDDKSKDDKMKMKDEEDNAIDLF